MDVSEHDWKQHFPTYSFKNRDIVLKEYESASAALESEERLFINATNITLVISAALSSAALGSLEKLGQLYEGVISPIWLLIILLSLVFSFSITTLKYFADRQKTLLFGRRKIVVLRRMLGLAYGSIQFVLPNWRVEGADQPFSIRMFPGWLSYVTYPFWVIAIFSGIITSFLSASIFSMFELISTQQPSILPCLVVSFVSFWLAILAYVYRSSLYDNHENTLLCITKYLAYKFNLRLVDNFEYIIYRAKLSIYEIQRMKIGLKDLKRILVFIEDREFYHHKGVSLRATFRAFLSLFGQGRRSGGSTITQQLVRTLFVEDFNKTIRRKIIEILLAKWFEKVASKKQIIEMYLSSVRFEKGVFGIPEAMKFYFEKILEAPSPAECFFLIERVSNVKARVLSLKIDHTIRQAVAAGVLTQSDSKEIVSIYSKMIKRMKISPDDNEKFESLKNNWLDGCSQT